MKQIIDEWIDIEAKPEEIWNVLLDFDSWKIWNPFIPMAEGRLEVGEVLQIKVTSPGMKSMIFKPQVFEVIPNEKILWGGSFLKIIYHGDHAFILEPLDEGKTRFRQVERFIGPIVLFMSGMIKKTELGYQEMNIALKKEVERRRINS